MARAEGMSPTRRLDDERKAVKDPPLHVGRHRNPRVPLSVVYFGSSPELRPVLLASANRQRGRVDIGLDKVTASDQPDRLLVAVPFCVGDCRNDVDPPFDATQEVWHVAGPAIVGGLSLIAPPTSAAGFAAVA
jgi:hypothetical protein